MAEEKIKYGNCACGMCKEWVRCSSQFLCSFPMAPFPMALFPMALFPPNYGSMDLIGGFDWKKNRKSKKSVIKR
jgi:hypothetical protein